MKIAFVACVEKGYLEGQTVLLCKSIRRFAGRFKSAPIFTFQPRVGTEITRTTSDTLEELGVRHFSIPLNREWHDYPYANKVFAAAYAEEFLPAEILVFADSDTVFVNEPQALDLPAGVDVAASTADSKYLSSSGEDDPRDKLWQQLHRFFSIEKQRFILTPTGVRTRPFFSAGLVAVRRTAGFFAAWRAALLALLGSALVPKGLRNRMDEISLTALLLGRFDRLRVLDGRYNYLLYRRGALAAPFHRARLEDLVHLHYRHWFNVPNFLSLLQPSFDRSGKIFQWLQRQLPLLPERALPDQPNEGDPWDFFRLNSPANSAHKLAGPI
jgi:hypothetical protein